jgi:hypothetical protein
MQLHFRPRTQVIVIFAWLVILLAGATALESVVITAPVPLPITTSSASSSLPSAKPSTLGDASCAVQGKPSPTSPPFTASGEAQAPGVTPTARSALQEAQALVERLQK